MISRPFRFVAGAALMGVLLLLYAAHPIAGWTTLLLLLIVTIATAARKARPERTVQ